MKILDFEKRFANRNHLSAVDILGSFDFSTGVVYLKSLTTHDVQQIDKLFRDYVPSWNNGTPNLMSGEQFLALSKVQPLAVHEYTHFIDSTSTLWGLRHLKMMNNAYSSVNRGEQSYHFAKEFSDHLKKIRLPSYYTIKRKCHTNRPWRSVITIGRIFDAKGKISENPILFSRFHNSSGEIMVRSPISTVSVLEASAMAQEIISHANLMNLTKSDFILVEEKEFTKKQLDFLYSPEVTEYSVCVHILANKVGYTDAMVAFRMCSRITRLALNFPLDLFKKLSENCPIGEILNIRENHDFIKAMRDGLRSYDLGVLFYILCNALPENISSNDADFTSGLDAALLFLGVSRDELMKSMDEEAKNIISEIDSSSIESIKMLANAGYKNFKIIKNSRDRLPFLILNLPPVLLGDDNIVSLFDDKNNSLRGFDVENCFFELDEGMDWVRRFSEACV